MGKKRGEGNPALNTLRPGGPATNYHATLALSWTPLVSDVKFEKCKLKTFRMRASDIYVPVHPRYTYTVPLAPAMEMKLPDPELLPQYVTL